MIHFGIKNNFMKIINNKIRNSEFVLKQLKLLKRINKINKIKNKIKDAR